MNPAALAIVLVLAAACGDSPAVPDATPTADAATADAATAPDVAAAADAAAPDAAGPAPDLSCLGAPPPAVAAESIEVRILVFAVADYAVSELAGASVELRARADGGVLAAGTTGEDGRITLALATGGVPVDAYLAVGAAGYLPTRLEPGEPLAADDDLLAVVASAAELGAWYAAAGDDLTGADATVMTVAVDCAGHTLAGSTVAVTPAPATQVYYDEAAQRWDPALAASSNGYTLATGVAAAVSATAAIGGVELPARAVSAAPGELTISVITPREPPERSRRSSTRRGVSWPTSARSFAPEVGSPEQRRPASEQPVHALEQERAHQRRVGAEHVAGHREQDADRRQGGVERHRHDRR